MSGRFAKNTKIHSTIDLQLCFVILIGSHFSHGAITEQFKNKKEQIYFNFDFCKCNSTSF
jgi:hypothetical protein